MVDDEVKTEIFRILDPRYLWLRAWFLHTVVGMGWKEVGNHLFEYNECRQYYIPVKSRTLAESTARQHGKKGQAWEQHRQRPLYFWLTLREHKALRALGVDPLHVDAVTSARIIVRSYKGRRLPPGVGKRSFHAILNLLDDLDEAAGHS